MVCFEACTGAAAHSSGVINLGDPRRSARFARWHRYVGAAPALAATEPRVALRASGSLPHRGAGALVEVVRRGPGPVSPMPRTGPSRLTPRRRSNIVALALPVHLAPSRWSAAHGQPLKALKQPRRLARGHPRSTRFASRRMPAERSVERGRPPPVQGSGGRSWQFAEVMAAAKAGTQVVRRPAQRA